MDSVANLPDSQRSELFLESANLMGVRAAIVEKDFWVVWVLDKIFSDNKLSKILMFKGGTSLSKVFNLIGRFSEDIDLILDWREVTKEDPQIERGSKNRQDKFNKQINKEAVVYIKNILLPTVSKIVSPLCHCEIDANNQYNIKITYPSAFKDGYLRSEILLEIGPLASWLPSDSFEIEPYASKYFPSVLKEQNARLMQLRLKELFGRRQLFCIRKQIEN